MNKTQILATYNAVKDDPSLSSSLLLDLKNAVRRVCCGFSTSEESRTFVQYTVVPLLEKAKKI